MHELSRVESPIATGDIVDGMKAMPPLVEPQRTFAPVGSIPLGASIASASMLALALTFAIVYVETPLGTAMGQAKQV